MWQRSPKYLWLVAIWLAANSSACAASSSPAKDAGPATAPQCVGAEQSDFQSVVSNEQAPSLASPKQKIGKTPAKAKVSNPLPMRLSRLRARSSVFNDSAFLLPDSLQMRDVRLQI